MLLQTFVITGFSLHTIIHLSTNEIQILKLEPPQHNTDDTKQRPKLATCTGRFHPFIGHEGPQGG